MSRPACATCGRRPRMKRETRCAPCYGRAPDGRAALAGVARETLARVAVALAAPSAVFDVAAEPDAALPPATPDPESTP